MHDHALISALSLGLMIFLSQMTIKGKTLKSKKKKLPSLCKAKDTVNKTKQPPTDYEMVFTNPKPDRGLIYKDRKKLDSREPNNPIKNGVQS